MKDRLSDVAVDTEDFSNDTDVDFSLLKKFARLVQGAWAIVPLAGELTRLRCRTQRMMFGPDARFVAAERHDVVFGADGDAMHQVGDPIRVHRRAPIVEARVALVVERAHPLPARQCHARNVLAVLVDVFFKSFLRWRGHYTLSLSMSRVRR